MISLDLMESMLVLGGIRVDNVIEDVAHLVADNFVLLDII